MLDYVATALDGRNLTLRGGLGNFVTHVLAPQAGPVFLDTPVQALDWRDGIRAETTRGTIRASAAIMILVALAAVLIPYAIWRNLRQRRESGHG